MRDVRRGWLAAGGAAVALIVGGCGAGAAHHAPRGPRLPTRPAPLSSTAPGSPPHARRRPLRGPRIGATQLTSYGGAKLAITIERLIDPLSGSGVALLPGTRAVGVEVKLVNEGPALYDSSATGDFSVIATRGPVTPVFVPSGPCQTPLNDFDRYMTDGSVRSGCVAFAMPNQARVRAVRFTPHAQQHGRLTWLPAG